jgi:hypothetical protein
LSGATYAGGGWLPWLSATSVDTLDQAQNRNLRVITGQLASTPNKALRVEAGVQSFGCLRDRAAAVALERSLRLDPVTHPRAAQANSDVTRQFKGGADGRSKRKEVVSSVGGGAGYPRTTPPTCSRIFPLGVGKGALDCLSVPQRWQRPK